MGSWHDMAESAVLERYARGDASQDLVDAWPSLRPHLCQRLRDNVRAFPVHTEPHLHKAAPLADLLRDDPTLIERPSAAIELLMTEHDITPDDTRGFVPARAPPPSAAWPTWDTALDGSHVDRVCEHVCAMLDDFDAPPCTMQRVAELLDLVGLAGRRLRARPGHPDRGPAVPDGDVLGIDGAVHGRAGGALADADPARPLADP